ncbi:hypothetical protein FQ185_27025 [Pseudomonas sp. ANT_H12B]|nr:hypothetical protein FQ185_27025 [Pseudomonas sp. ANT_H12B]
MPGTVLGGTHITCGSGLARDSGVSANINVECESAIASKLPQGIFSGHYLGGNLSPSPPPILWPIR